MSHQDASLRDQPQRLHRPLCDSSLGLLRAISRLAKIVKESIASYLVMSHVRELEYPSLLESPLIELLAEDEIS
jgi:hypothetical protein